MMMYCDLMMIQMALRGIQVGYERDISDITKNVFPGFVWKCGRPPNL
jgi:hypothetical protein